MAILSMVVAIVVLGILYKRMIGREVPEPITKAQALVPIGLGVASLVVAFLITIGVSVLILKTGYDPAAQPLWLQSVIRAFLGAGFPEELSKFLMILIAVTIFRSRIRNVYEYVLVGVAVGFGFTIFEEYLYGSALVNMLIRLALIAAHVIFSMIMAYFLGRARYQRLTGEGSAAVSYVLAFLIPIAMHTIYDACTGLNAALASDDDRTVMIGMVIAAAGTVVMFILQIVLLRRLRKDAERLSMMKLVRTDAGADT